METLTKRRSLETANVVLDKTQPVNYSSGKAPDSYSCTNCGNEGVKLWRAPGRFNNHAVICVKCTCLEQKIEILSVDEKGSLEQPGTRKRTVQLGSRIPAIPKPENDSFWGYQEVPVAGQAWWQGLPNY